jgi:eukaryotic-like serine/threonine-protein kinase
MTTPLHPDQLEIGHQVGPWRIVGSLGAGGFGRVFKVERGGNLYALKLALRPAAQHSSDEEDVNGRLAREVAALLTCAPHPNLPRVHAVDRWPEPPDGYLFHVTDYVDGETFHEWRWRVKPSAAHLLTVYTEVVRVVADLHRRGVHHRDLKADNLLIRRSDERPILIDLGTARIPGASTLTVGVAPASPHLLPPECVSFLREGSWKSGASFDAGIPGDLYALGALLYESLTDGYAFDPRLPYDRLLPAIESVVPRAPKDVNPKVPSNLSDITMRLLSKRPEDRYSGTETLLQALWDAAKDKRQSDWRVSLDVPVEPDAATPDRGVVSLAQFPLSIVSESAPATTATEAPASSVAPESPPAPTPPVRRRRPAAALGVAALLLGLLVFGLFRLAPERPPPLDAPVSEKGSPSVTPTPSLPDASVLAMATSPDAGASSETEPAASESSVPLTEAERPSAKSLERTDAGIMRKLAGAAAAACVGVSCAGGNANVRKDETLPCPAGAIEFMKARKMITDPATNVIVVNDPKLDTTEIKEGPITAYASIKVDRGRIPDGSVLKGRVIFTPEKTRIYFTQVTWPDGEVYPVCLEFYPKASGHYGFGLDADWDGPIQPNATTRKVLNRLWELRPVGRLNKPNEF